MSQNRNGMSAKELQRHLGVTYKTAWRIFTQIRKLMNDKGGKMSGIVEADETYIGGKGKNNLRGRGAENKTPVVGIVERKGRVKAVKTDNVKSSTVMPLLRDNVVVGTKLMTDEYGIYNKASKAGYKHEKIMHGAKEYVRGNVHTNTIEGFWSQVKRSIDGTYHSVSPKYLQSYLNEFAFRYNRKTSSSHLFWHLLERI